MHNGPQRLTWRRDKKMIIGLILIALTCIVLALGPGRPFLKETYLLVKAWLTPEPDEPPLEVDPLKINYQLQSERQQTGDSLAAAQHIDSLRRDIRQKSVPVYRPPIKKEKWYLSEKDMKELRRGAENKAEE